LLGWQRSSYVEKHTDTGPLVQYMCCEPGTSGHPGSPWIAPQSPPNEFCFEQAVVIVTSSVANGFQFVSRTSISPGSTAKMAPIALTDGRPVCAHVMVHAYG
jgi:hypothetical protein